MATKYKYTLQNIKTPANIFTKIYKSITKYPQRYDQRAWHSRARSVFPSWPDRVRAYVVGIKEIRSCNTAHCFAGWGAVHTPGALQVERDGQFTSAVVFNRGLFNAGRERVSEELFEGNRAPRDVKAYILDRAIREEGFVPPKSKA